MKRRFPWRPVWVLLAVAAVAYGVAATPGFRRAAALRRWQPDCPQWEVTWHSGTRTALGLGHEHVDWVALDNELLVAKGPAIRVGGRRQALQLLRIHADGTVTEGPTLGALDLQDQWRQGGETYLLSKMKRFPGFKLTRVDPARLAAAEHISIPHGERPAGIHSKLPTGRFLGTLPDGTLAFITQVECEYISAASVAPGIRNPFHLTHLHRFDPGTDTFAAPLHLEGIDRPLSHIARVEGSQIRLSQQDRLVQGAAAAPDQVAVDPATGVLTPLPPLGSDALSALPQVTGGASTGFLLLTNVLEPPAGVAIAAIRVPQPVPAGVRLELTLRRLLPRLLANRPPLFARRPQRRQGMLDGLQLDDVHAVLGPKPPSGAMPPTAPMGDDLSTAVLGTIYNTGMPLQLHAVDGRTALVSQIVAPVPSLGHHVGILRLGALTPPSAAIDWLGYLPLPASIGDVPGNVHVDLFATPDAWLVGLTRVPYPTADPERGDWSATFYAGERHWARVPYPAGWTPRGEGRLGYTAPAGLLDRPWTEG